MNKKILIVDDLVENIQIIISIFEKQEPNYTLFQATDGELAFIIAKRIKLDLIISDWDMPNVDGIELLKLLKKDKDTKDIPVIMATGIMTTVEHLQMALDSGATDYIRKPIDDVELVARTRSALTLSYYNKKTLERKNQELIENTLYLIRNNKFNIQISKKLKILQKEFNTKNKTIVDLIDEISKDIEDKIKTDSWKRFEITFSAVYDDFHKNLFKDFPNLSATEIKISTFLKLGLNSKDIASILFITPQSVKVSRSRLRKKLGISSDVNLQIFLSKY